jgi:hypothetical protein
VEPWSETTTAGRSESVTDWCSEETPKRCSKAAVARRSLAAAARADLGAKTGERGPETVADGGWVGVRAQGKGGREVKWPGARELLGCDTLVLLCWALRWEGTLVA